MFGIVSKSVELSKSEWLSEQKGTWGYGCDGLSYYDGVTHGDDGPNPKPGEKVWLTLDLRGEGTLNATIVNMSFGETRSYPEIKNLRDNFGQGNFGFLPAAEADSTTGFKLLDYKIL